MKYQDFCNQIIKLVGGRENIEAVVHCMTRLRFTLKDRSLANTEEIKAMKDVIDVVSNEVAYQVIIGTQVAEIHEELLQILGLEEKQTVSVKKNPAKAVLDLVSESMSPILEPILASGILAAILSVLSLTGLVSPESPTYALYETLRMSIFFFLPIFMAMSCAKRLNASPYLAVALAAVLVSQEINGVEGLSIFGIALPTITYSNSFFPIILGVWFMGIVTRFLNKFIPDKITYFVNPALTLAICFPVTLLFFGPIGTWIGDAINIVCNLLMNTIGNWSVTMLYAACQPFLIMMGAGNFIIPIYMNFYSTLGYDPIFTIAWVVSDIAVCGAVCGYFLKTKDSKQKQLFGTTAFSAFMGITEPAVYGVFVKYRRPFIAVMIGGGLGGLYAGITHVVGYAPVGFLGIASFIGDSNTMNLVNAFIASMIGLFGAMIAAYVLGIPNDENVKKEDKKVLENGLKKDDVSFVKSEVFSPVKGKMVPLQEVNDKAFSSGALGKGFAVEAQENMIHAPIDGEVVSLFPTYHAIGIKGEYGIEVLIHIGIDTVELEGQYFTSCVKQGDKVKKGDSLIKADFQKIKDAGYDPTVIVVITNSSDYLEVLPTEKDEFLQYENALTIIV